MQALELELGRGQLLQGVVVEVARDSLVRLVDGGGDVLEQHLTSSVHLLQALHGLLEVRLRVLELPHQARGKPGVLQNPGVFP